MNPNPYQSPAEAEPMPARVIVDDFWTGMAKQDCVMFGVCIGMAVGMCVMFLIFVVCLEAKFY